MERVIRINDKETAPSAVEHFFEFLSYLNKTYPDQAWPKADESRVLLTYNKPMYFYFANDDIGRTAGGLMVHEFEHASGKKSAYGWLLVVDPLFNAKEPVGSLLIEKLKEDFEVICLRALPLGLKYNLPLEEGLDEEKKIINFYKALGFISTDSEHPSNMIWER